jgi:hypothetical protein
MHSLAASPAQLFVLPAALLALAADRAAAQQPLLPQPAAQSPL